jgi:hypothetical protein
VKNFDDLKSTEREFLVGGETFHWRDVRPEALQEFEPKEGDKATVWQIIDEQILLFIVPTEHEQWKTVRGRDENAVTIAQIQAIVTWLMEEQTGHPTEQPAPSDPGRGKTAVTSKAA